MVDALKSVNLRVTPQTVQADPAQVVNHAGGYVFQVSDAENLRRFLVNGTDGGTFYASVDEHTADAVGVRWYGPKPRKRPDLAAGNAPRTVLDWARSNPVEMVRHIVEISEAGRAPRVNPCLFALAAAASLSDETGRKAALAALSRVARTGTHLFQFAGYARQFRGWGPTLCHAVAAWYTEPPVAHVAYQAAKYRQREGWTHRDLLRLAHPRTADTERRALFDWICGRKTEPEGAVDWHLPLIIEGYERAQAATSVQQWMDVILEYPGISWEMLPDAARQEPAVWEALIAKGMPMGALIRNLATLTRRGVLTQMGGSTARVCAQLVSQEHLVKARIHPVNVLVALRTYAAGRSVRNLGGGRTKVTTWTPVPQVIDALDAAFYAAYGAVTPAGKRTLIGLDISGSMAYRVSNLPLSAREVTAAVSLVTAATEPEWAVMGFGHTFVPLNISPRQRLDDAIRTISNLPWQGTDCALPMLWARANNVAVDTFCVYTDNETWTGAIHPHQALRQYRDHSGINAKLIVCGTLATPFSIADPADKGMLDVIGMDSAVPNLISDFSRGE